MREGKQKHCHPISNQTERAMKKRWKGIVACLCLLVLVALWRETLTTLNEIILLAR